MSPWDHNDHYEKFSHFCVFYFKLVSEILTYTENFNSFLTKFVDIIFMITLVKASFRLLFKYQVNWSGNVRNGHNK